MKQTSFDDRLELRLLLPYGINPFTGSHIVCSLMRFPVDEIPFAYLCGFDGFPKTEFKKEDTKIIEASACGEADFGLRLCVT